MYLVKTPLLLKKIYASLIWNINTNAKDIYLTFDDGPHPIATPFVLNELKNYNALATFFCIGKNVDEHPNIYSRIIAEGHSIGNHTNNHLNGFKTPNATYIENIELAAQKIDSNIFRPPYGKISFAQAQLLHQLNYKIIMWDVLSGDFDISLSNEKCLHNVTNNATNGSIIVFHDSQKALSKLQYTLPKVLEYFGNKGYQFKKIAMNSNEQ